MSADAKRLAWVLRVARFTATLLCLVAVATATPGAYANFGPHAPGATPDTDTCAMCHRAHTSFSDSGWTDQQGADRASALLVGSAATTTGYCLVCHGNGAPGAATNVMSGIFEGSEYETSSTVGAALNAGGFDVMPDPYTRNANGTGGDLVPATSRHDLDTGPLPLWGAGTELKSTPGLTCTSCHDAHPTSNYRMLKGSINATTVGGYSDASGETPNAFVFSTETGYPVPGADPANPGGGFLKGAAGAAQVEAYRPNYTGGSLLNITSVEANKSLSVWCSSCHTGYRKTSALATVTVNYGIYEQNPVTNVQVGAMERHFHPTDVTLEKGYGPDRSLPATVVPDQNWVPLETAQGGNGEFYKNYIGCSTCHRAHGSSTVMTGWAASHLETNTANAWVPVQDNIPGINPAKQVPGGSPAVGSSALLRTNNRGVCERCHGG